MPPNPNAPIDHQRGLTLKMAAIIYAQLLHETYEMFRANELSPDQFREVSEIRAAAAIEDAEALCAEYDRRHPRPVPPAPGVVDNGELWPKDPTAPTSTTDATRP